MKHLKSKKSTWKNNWTNGVPSNFIRVKVVLCATLAWFYHKVEDKCEWNFYSANKIVGITPIKLGEFEIF